MEDMFYKLPLDGETDGDLIKWINSMPRNKKAEVIRHALRFYKSYLVEDGTLFVMPNAPQVEKPEKVKKKVGINKSPVRDLGSLIKGE